MINLIHILPVFLMVARKPQEESRPKWYPNNNDVADLKEKLSHYTQIRINTKLQTRFDQHCKTLGIISFNEAGYKIMHNPTDYNYLSKINERLEGKQNADNEVYLEQHPEEREKLFEKIKNMGKLFKL